MKNILIFSTLLILSFFLSGCSSSYAVHLTNSMEIREMNEQLKGRIVTIESKNGMDIWAKDVNISKDSISWFNWQQESTTWASKESKASIPPFGTFTIVIKNHFRGALEGLGFGLSVGMFAAFELTPGPNLSTPDRSFRNAIYGAIGGAVAGFIGGATIGHSNNYEIQWIEQIEH